MRRQYSGNAGGVVKGIGIVTCVYYNASADRFWVIDYRIFDPDRDGKTKLDHLSEMLDSICSTRHPISHRVDGFVVCHHRFDDQSYQSGKVVFPRRLSVIGKLMKLSVKSRNCAVETLCWTTLEEQTGKVVKLKGFAGQTRLKLFRVAVSTNRTEYLVTNEMTQSDSDAAQKESGHRWKIEQFHREAKQTTGLERYQCRLNRSQRNHIAAGFRRPLLGD